MRDLAAAAAAVPVLALVYAEILVRRLRLVGILALPVLASIYAVECARRPRLGLSALTLVLVPLVAVGALAGAAPAALDARPPGTAPSFDATQLRPIGGAVVGAATGVAPVLRAGDGASRPVGDDRDVNAAADAASPTEGLAAAAAAATTDETAAGVATAGPTATSLVPAVGFDEPVQPPPTVIRFRPLGGATGVDRAASLSVRFDRAMDREATAPAFGATIDGQPVEGTLRWAEGDTVLVLEPDAALPFGARVVLRVEAGALATDGQPLAEARAISFTVEPEPTPTPASTPRPAEPPRTTAGAAAPGGWGWPLDGPITQYFGQSLTIYGTHRGLDIDGDTGDPIRAAASGTVVVAGYYDRCGGLDVHIDHGDGLVSWYRHLSKVLVEVGQRVDRGDRIGLVGNTGCSTGSHLHFAVRRGSTWLDPLDFLPRR